MPNNFIFLAMRKPERGSDLSRELGVSDLELAPNLLTSRLGCLELMPRAHGSGSTSAATFFDDIFPPSMLVEQYCVIDLSEMVMEMCYS